MDKNIIKVKMTTFLPPIEKPKGLMMKLAYYLTRRQFGKVITPLKVHAVPYSSAFRQTGFPSLIERETLKRFHSSGVSAGKANVRK